MGNEKDCLMIVSRIQIEVMSIDALKTMMREGKQGRREWDF